MNLVTIAYKSIRQRALASSLTALSVALGVMLMVSVLVIHGIIDRVFGQQSIGYNLIVGPARGSEMQLVLNTVYRVWRPSENLPYIYYKELAESEEFAPYVEDAIPICLGDVTQEGNFPIVGTNKRFFEVEYAPGKKFRLNKEGHEFRKSFDAIIGSEVVRKNGWKEGATFTMLHGGAEGHVHDEKYTVVGRLEPTGTPNDKTVFVHLNGFYAIADHETPPEQALKQLQDFYPKREDIQKLTVADIVGDGHHHDNGDEEGVHHHHGPISDYLKEVTSVLIVSTKDDEGFAAVSANALKGKINQARQAQAVSPIGPMRVLMDLFVGNVKHVLLFLTGMIIIVSGVGIFVSIYNSMADRRREIAIMRALGANRQTVFSIILTESILLCFSGGVFGILLGHGLVFAAAPFVAAQSGLLIDPFAFEWIELVILPVLLVLASLVGFIPGMTAYRTDVAETLAD